MDDMDVTGALRLDASPPAVLWETRFAICQRLRIGGVELRRMIRDGQIVTRQVNGERAFREASPRSTARRARATPPTIPADKPHVVQRARPKPATETARPDWIVEMFVDRLTDAHGRIGSLESERDALAHQVAALQALVDIQQRALGDAQGIIELLRAKPPRPHGATTIRRFGRDADW